MRQKEYWNKVSSDKKFTTPFQVNEFGKYVNKEMSILDIGCGYGRTLDELYQLGYRNLAGMDFSEGMINRGKIQFPYLDLRVQATENIDMADESLEAVILFAVLTCISENSKQIHLMNEIYRVLKPNGFLYINDFLLNSDERNIDRYEKYQKSHSGEYGTFELPEGAICRHHEEQWIGQLLSAYQTEEYKAITFTTMNGNISNGFYFIGQKR